MPSQRRLAIWRLQVPNLDGTVPATAGNLLSIGTQRHRSDPEIREKSVKKSTEIRRKNLQKKLTSPSAPSASTGNLQIPSPKSWWCCPNCRWQFVFHRGSKPLTRPWNCEKSGAESTETERKKQGKTYSPKCPVIGHSLTYILKSLTIISFSSICLSTKSYLFE